MNVIASNYTATRHSTIKFYLLAYFRRCYYPQLFMTDIKCNAPNNGIYYRFHAEDA